MDRSKFVFDRETAAERAEPAGTAAAPSGRQGGRRPPRKATSGYLQNAALYYLQRYATSSANLRRLLMRRVHRSAQAHGTDPADGAAIVEELIARFQRAGLLDDAGYAAAKAETLFRRGDSQRAIRRRLAAKGVDGEDIQAALDSLAAEGRDDRAAAVALVRRRRLGPLRPAADRAAYRERDLGALARAGFSFEIARQVLACEDEDELDMLERQEG